MKALLAEMQTSRPLDNSWLFPSPQRGTRDVAAQTLRESLKLVRVKAGLPKVGGGEKDHSAEIAKNTAGLLQAFNKAWTGGGGGGGGGGATVTN